MKLVLPSAEYAEEIRAFRQEFLDTGSSCDGQGTLRRMEDPLEWIAYCEKGRHKETVPQSLVPATQFLYVRQADGRVVGMIQVRHEFNEFLEKYGGHIGYSVRPSERRKGYAKAMLAAALPFCWHELGLDRVLVSCLRENEGSRRTILANGGIYESTVLEPLDQVYLERYWIERPRRLLITGFEPFGKDSLNPSWEAVNRLPEKIGPWTLEKLLLPVTFGEAAHLAIAAAEHSGADAAVSVGLAGGRRAVTVEMAALNLRYASMADNAGFQPQDMPVAAGGPAAYFSTLPVRKMAQAVCEAGLAGAVSYSAGTYVCNDVMYSLLHHFAGTPVKAGFIHVPWSEGMGEPAWQPEDIVRALEAAIRAM